MASTTDITRRSVLAGAGAGVGILALAACTSGPGGGTTAPTDVDIPPGEVLAPVADVPVGGALSVSVGSAPVLVTQPSAGQVFAFSAICTHERCTVGPGDGELRCPCHASRYDLTTGAVLGGPAPLPLPSIPVEIADGAVVTA